MTSNYSGYFRLMIPAPGWFWVQGGFVWSV